MIKFVDFCIKNDIRFNISDVEHYNAETYEVDEKEIEIALYKYDCKSVKHVGLAELRDEGLNFEDVCYSFAKNFNNFCEKVGE